MGFQSGNLTATNVSQSNSGRQYMYKYDTDSLAVIMASAYFSTADTVTGITGNDMGLIDEDTIYIIGSDGLAIIEINVTTAGVISVTKVLSGGANIEIKTAALAPALTDSGKTFVLSAAAGVAVTLPAVALGLKYRFISGDTVVTSVGHVFTATTAKINGSVTVAGLVVAGADRTVITMTANAVLSGDWFEITSDGINWYISGQAAASTGIVFTS